MVWLQHAIVFLIIFVGPVRGYFAFRRLKTKPSTGAKVRFYRQGMAVQWILSASVLVAAGPAIFWAPPQFHWMHAIWAKIAGFVFAAGIAVVLLFPFLTLRKPKTRAAIRRAFEPLDFFLPMRRGEFGWFGALCVTGGICEEWLARGFLFRYFGQTPWHWGTPVAFAVATLAFGVNHIYQGWGGVLSTTLTGAAMGLLYLWTGSLLAPMIAHMLLDLRALFLLKAVHVNKPDQAHAADLPA